MNYLQDEEVPFEYRHKKFDVKRHGAANDSEPTTRKRSWSFGSDCSSEMSSEADSIAGTPLTKRPKVMQDGCPMKIAATPMPVKLSTKNLGKLPKIKEETFERIYKYHGNMVRQFPQKQRTARDQERRDKNTLACRQSRFIKKWHCVVIEEKYKDFTEQYQNIVEETMRTGYYMQQLLKLSAINAKPVPKQSKGKPATNSKKPFTIAYLLKSH